MAPLSNNRGETKFTSPSNCELGPTCKIVPLLLSVNVCGIGPTCVNRNKFNVPLVNPDEVIEPFNIDDAEALVLNVIPEAPPVFDTEIFPLYVVVPFCPMRMDVAVLVFVFKIEVRPPIVNDDPAPFKKRKLL